MNRKIVAAMFVVLLTVSANAQIADKQIVDNAFPQNLNDGDGKRFSRFIAADLNGDGHPLLVAVYTNLAGGAIRVLNRAGQVLAAPVLPGMRGFHANVQAVDLDGDGKREIIAEFTTGHSPDNPDSWVFRWTGTSLQLISPTCAAGNLQLSCLGRVSMIDVNGDGKLSLLNWPAFEVHGSTVAPAGKWTLYNIVDGALQATPESFVFAREFRREKGGPFTSEGKFVATAGPGTLRIVTGADGVSSGHVTFNGIEVLRDLKHGQRVYNVLVAHKSSNTVTVRLEGKPGSSLTVLVIRQ